MIRHVLQAQRIGRRQRDGAPPGFERFVETAEDAVDFADVAQIERRIDAVGERALHQIERAFRIAKAERHDTGEMQGVRLLGVGGEDVIEQAPGVVEAAAALIFVGDTEHFAERQWHRAGARRPSWRGWRLHQSIV
jgi:hypothetical protein